MTNSARVLQTENPSDRKTSKDKRHVILTMMVILAFSGFVISSYLTATQLLSLAL